MALLAAAVTGLGVSSQAQEATEFNFDQSGGLAGWTVNGDVALDPSRDRQGAGGSLKIGPGGSATLELRAQDGSGKVELWVYDDGSKPQNPKASRIGPRWGLVQSDGRIMAAGVFYASYLGGDEGYSASANNGSNWFGQMFWLGINRAPSGWHKWTLDLDPDMGMRIFHNDKEVTASLDQAKLKGFASLQIWGDTGQENGQTIWVDDVSVVLGGPAHLVEAIEADPYDERAVAEFVASRPTPVVYSKDNVPATPKLEDLSLKDSVSEYGMTWHFDQPARVGQFVNGDWYVVEPVTVTAIDPKPLYGAEIPRREIDAVDKERPGEQRVRNGFMVNPPAQMRVAYDSGVRNFFDPSLIQKLPVTLKAGDSLVSAISMPKGLVLKPQLWEKVERGVEDGSPVRAAAVLTCVSGQLAADAFRPGFCDRQARIYYSRNLRKGLLPALAAPKSQLDVWLYIRFTHRPWVGTCFFGFEGPVENMPQYGRDYARVVGLDALLLCTDLSPEQKETLLVDFVQVGIDLGSMIRSGHPGWEGFGGHGSGRKLPIVLAGLLLGDDQLANINRSFPRAHFGEDEQTAYGDGWTGAKVVFTGHRAIDEAAGIARPGTGPYEQTPPSTWREGREKMSESYRRCCTSAAWIAQALVLHLLKAEPPWAHDAFLDYCDRWMYEDETQALKTLKQDANMAQPDWAQEGKAWEPFVNEMWARYRTAPGMPPTDGWRKPHDDAYLRAAIEKAKAVAK